MSARSLLAARIKVRERPILFSAPMVRAILDGKKTQTRRIVKNETGACSECFAAAVPHNEGDGGVGIFGTDPYLRVAYCEHADRGGGRIRCRHGAVGERLWIKETFQIECNRGIEDSTTYPPRFNDGRPVQWHEEDDWGRWWQQPHYRATDGEENDLVDYEEEDENGDDKPLGWKPSIFMPRWASRIDLEIASVRVERLQEITEDDARAEGIHHHDGSPFQSLGPGGCAQVPTTMVVEARSEFRHLWDGINGERAAWSTNPWVWVVSFKRIENGK